MFYSRGLPSMLCLQHSFPGNLKTDLQQKKADEKHRANLFMMKSYPHTLVKRPTSPNVSPVVCHIYTILFPFLAGNAPNNSPGFHNRERQHIPGRSVKELYSIITGLCFNVFMVMFLFVKAFSYFAG